MKIELSVWIYWAVCLAAATTVVLNREFAYGLLRSPTAQVFPRYGYGSSLTIAWVLTLLAAGSYVALTHKQQTGSYDAADLIAFAVLNGVLEQFMFIFWFLLGCYLTRVWRANHPIAEFFVGYLTYAIYSGVIHAWFWMGVLPPHVPNRIVTVPSLSIMALSWMWLLWRYRAVVAIIVMHVTMDMLMIGHLHSHWFERGGMT
jgi:chlorophyllide a hydrolase